MEALADGTLLVLVLLVASAMAATPSLTATNRDASRYAEDYRLALFRTTLDGLAYATVHGFVALPNGTTVETFLLVQVELRARNPALDFSESNARIEELALRLVRPGWGVLVVGRFLGQDTARIPDLPPPSSYFAAGWTYPAPGGTGGIHLFVAVWPNPPR